MSARPCARRHSRRSFVHAHRLFPRDWCAPRQRALVQFPLRLPSARSVSHDDLPAFRGSGFPPVAPLASQRVASVRRADGRPASHLQPGSTPSARGHSDGPPCPTGRRGCPTRRARSARRQRGRGTCSSTSSRRRSFLGTGGVEARRGMAEDRRACPSVQAHAVATEPTHLLPDPGAGRHYWRSPARPRGRGPSRLEAHPRRATSPGKLNSSPAAAAAPRSNSSR
jgi:hypothetical protein